MRANLSNRAPGGFKVYSDTRSSMDDSKLEPPRLTELTNRLLLGQVPHLMILWYISGSLPGSTPEQDSATLSSSVVCIFLPFPSHTSCVPLCTYVERHTRNSTITKNNRSFRHAHTRSMQVPVGFPPNILKRTQERERGGGNVSPARLRRPAHRPASVASSWPPSEPTPSDARP